jgi:hypothetical protein
MVCGLDNLVATPDVRPSGLPGLTTCVRPDVSLTSGGGKFEILARARKIQIWSLKINKNY